MQRVACYGVVPYRTGLKHGMDQETDRKTDRLNLRFVASQVMGRAFTVVVHQHWSPEHPCKFLLPRLHAQLAEYYRKKNNDTRQVGLVLHRGGLVTRLGVVSPMILSTALCITS